MSMQELFQKAAPLSKEQHSGDHAEREEDRGEGAAVRKGVDGLHDPTAGQEGSEDAQQVRALSQGQIAGIQHVALLMHHSRVPIGDHTDTVP